jgi:hypothetical protein
MGRIGKVGREVVKKLDYQSSYYCINMCVLMQYWVCWGVAPSTVCVLILLNMW